jgi:hypothetical protein
MMGGHCVMVDSKMCVGIEKAYRPRSDRSSVVQRIDQSTRELEPRDLHFAANAGDQHHHTCVRLFEVEEQDDAARALP